MIARVVTVAVKPGKLEAFAAFFQGERLVEIREAAGNRGFYLLANPQENTAVLCSLWESEAAIAASAPTFQAHATLFSQYLAGPPSGQGYEVRVAGSSLQPAGV